MQTKVPVKKLQPIGAKIEDLQPFLVEDFDLPFLKQLIEFDQTVFEDGSGVNEWSLVPLIRHGQIYILEDSRELLAGSAGFMRDWSREGQVYFYSYAISPNHQGKGLGYRFLKTLCTHLKEIGIKGISLTVDPNNTSAIKVYREKIGFKVTAIHENEYGEGFTRWIMKLDL